MQKYFLFLLKVIACYIFARGNEEHVALSGMLCGSGERQGFAMKQNTQKLHL